MSHQPRRPFTQPKPQAGLETAAAISHYLHQAIEHCGGCIYAADNGAGAYHMARIKDHVRKAAEILGIQVTPSEPFQFDGRAETATDETGFRS